MSNNPIITFMAGACELDESSTPFKVSPKSTPGYIYIYKEDDLHHFCWRPRSVPASQPTLELIMFPGDGSFKPYERPSSSSTESKSPTNGRIYVLKFSSSSSRYLFWLQSKSQHASGDPSWFSPRDLKIGQIVDKLLQGEDVDVHTEITNIPEDRGDGGDDDATMEDADGPSFGADLQHAMSGGAGADATGGDYREEGEEAREGGADGGRAAAPSQTDAEVAVQNFLRSLQGNPSLSAGAQQSPQGKPFTTLPDLLSPPSTLQILDTAPRGYIDSLLTHIPPVLLLLAQEADDISSVDPTPETAAAAIEALSLDQKKDILRKVLRSPQFSQSLGSLTMALRDGGLPTVSEALGVKVENGGFMVRGGMPLGGGEAVEAFLEGVKKGVEEEMKAEEGHMDTY
ncbi:hypothetical protein MMC15_004009 [Xylographa vitiligo]|nr:hypothetical protein [Xylographa vitiligo]